MQQVYINQLSKHAGEEVTLRGWLYNMRSSGKLMFPQLRDGTGVVQCVVLKKAVAPEVWESLSHLGQESPMVVRGTVRADERAPGGYEVDVVGAEVLQRVEGYPITPKEHGTEFLMDHRHLWLRSRRQHAILLVRHTIINAVRDFLNRDGHILCDTPILTPAACEGTTTLFEVDYFGDEKAYLSQSGQLYNEATAAAFGKVYCFGPTFRAERSKTRRHLTEFWMVEPEMAYATLEDVIDLAEGLVVSVVQRVLEKRQPELKVLERDVTKLERVKGPFPRVSYDDAAKILKEKGLPFEWGGDFGAPDETALSAGDLPVFVHGFPSAIKAFYMKPHPERPEVSLSVDLLAPEGYGEIIGGGQRLEDYDLLVQRIKEHDLPQEAFEWYLDLRRFGSVPHGGVRLG